MTLQPDFGGATAVAICAHARAVPSLERERFAAGLAALPPAPGAFLLRTCHRVEAYLAPAAFRTPLPDLPAGIEVRTDAEAAAHLASVACGAESAVFGDEQILHQIREALADRHHLAPLDPTLERLVQGALHAGRRARTWFTGAPRSLSDVALDRVARSAGDLAGRRVLVVGTGRMGRLAAFAAVRRGAVPVISNRTPERAASLAAETGGAAVAWGADGVLPDVAGVITAIAGTWPVGPRDAARLVAEGVPLVDLSSPPAVTADLQAALGERFVGVDDLEDGPEFAPQERVRRRLARLIEDTGSEYATWLGARRSVPTIQAMTDSAEGVRRTEVDWLLHHLPELGAAERSVIEQMSHRLVAAILHAPLAALSRDGSGEHDRAARELFGL